MKRILITGGSSGIGLELARVLHRRGHEVWTSSRRPAPPPEPERWRTFALDLADPDAAAEALVRTWDAAGGFDAVVHNAGSGLFGPVEAVSAGEWERLARVLLISPVRGTAALLERARARGGVSFVFITSLAGEQPVPFLGPYSALKAALSQAVRAWRLEDCGGRVRFVDVKPGDVRTGFNHAMPDAAAGPAAGEAPRWEAMRRLFAVMEAEGAEAAGVAGRLADLVTDAAPPGAVALGPWLQRAGCALLRLLPSGWTDRALAAFFRWKT